VVVLGRNPKKLEVRGREVSDCRVIGLGAWKRFGLGICRWIGCFWDFSGSVCADGDVGVSRVKKMRFSLSVVAFRFSGEVGFALGGPMEGPADSELTSTRYIGSLEGAGGEVGFARPMCGV